MYAAYIKRLIDIFLSFLALFIVLPLMLIIAIIIKIDSKGSVFFKQKRVGKNKQHFNIIKFRTMQSDTPKDIPTHKLNNPEQHITKVGRFLRRTSLDEMPQVLQIFTGKMSIIGPRPALYNQSDLITLRDLNGASALVPGLTGYAQINGRDELPIAIKASLDGYYAENISFLLDVKIFFKTISNVFKAKDIVEGEHEEIISTERLYLRKLCHEDIADLAAMLKNPNVMKAYEGPFNDSEVQDWLGKQQKRYEEDGFGLWALVLKDNGIIVGQAGLTKQDVGAQDKVCEIGYMLKEEYWHKGYAIEAAQACKQYVFEKLKYEKVYSIIRDNNVASQHVAERNGMTKEGEIIKPFKGKELLHYIYSVEKK